MRTVQLLFEVSFWICFGVVLYVYVGYPLLIACLAKLFGQRAKVCDIPDQDLPSVSLLISAYNEESVIEERIRNALAVDYPLDKLEIVIASDGSSDATSSIVRGYESKGVRLLEFAERRGKATVLNAALRELKGDLVLLSDANTVIEPKALRKMVRWFVDPKIGAVCGRLILTDPRSGRNADSMYWRYETFLKRQEGCLGALIGANGAIYAIRKDLYVPIPGETLVDDLVLPLLAKMNTGCSIVYEPEAVAFEETPENVGSEFHRRSRIGAGGFQSIQLLWRLLDPRRGWISFTFFSHKVLRWCCPFFLIGMLVTNLFLIAQLLYLGGLIGQFGFYLLSLLMAYVPSTLKPLKLLRLSTMFTTMNLALLVGFWRWLWGSQKAAWKRTERPPLAPA